MQHASPEQAKEVRVLCIGERDVCTRNAQSIRSWKHHSHCSWASACISSIDGSRSLSVRERHTPTQTQRQTEREGEKEREREREGGGHH